MPFYTREIDSGRHQLWRIEGDLAYVEGMTNVEDSLYYHQAPNGDIWSVLQNIFPLSFVDPPNSPFIQLTLPPGQYYPRMVRRTTNAIRGSVSYSPPISPADVEFAAIAKGQLQSLTAQLFGICQTVHPSTDNLNVYGHDIRNLLILACTEVEAHLKGVLRVNGIQVSDATQAEYIQVSEALRLPEYTVVLPAFPWLAPFRPFSRWLPGAETLPWYTAYNAVKHDRERKFERGTLGHAFNAVCGCATLLIAQFGYVQIFGKNSELSSTFQFIEKPEFPYETFYFESVDGSDWMPARYPFTPRARRQPPSLQRGTS